MTIKQVIVIRKDLKMRRGKEIAQGAHASSMWLIKRVKDMERMNDRLERMAGGHEPGHIGLGLTTPESDWLYGIFTKITLSVDSEAELLAVYEKANAAGLEVHLITDAGKTEFGGVPTNTALAIGPDEDLYIDPITSSLKLY